MVAVASAAFGLAACSSPGRHPESAGAARPLSAPVAPGTVRAEPVHAAPIVSQGQNPQAGQAVRHDAAPIGAPGLVPSGTTDAVRQAARPHTAVVRAAEGVAPAPASPRPAPPPPLPAPAQDPNPGYAPNAAATSQIMDAVAAAHADGKMVLLDFGAARCTACRALDRAMHTPKVLAVLARSYHVVRIDLGNADPRHLQIATPYAAFGSFGMPLLVVLNPDGTARTNSAVTGQPGYTEADLAAWLSQWAAR